MARAPINIEMNDISGLSFGQTVDLLGNAVKGADLEQSQIANNLANVNTPNFRRSTTSFKEALQRRSGRPRRDDDMALKTNDDRQFFAGRFASAGGRSIRRRPSMRRCRCASTRATSTSIKRSAKLSANSGYEQTMTQLLAVQYKRLREAIRSSRTNGFLRLRSRSARRAFRPSGSRWT